VDLLLLASGGLLLYLGAEWLVAGASRLATSFRIPELLVGLTVVAYGTSAPEAVVSIDAAVRGHGAMAVANVVGSNMANLGLILGVSALIKPAYVDGALRRRELPVLLLSTLALPATLFDGTIARWEAAGLVAGALAYTAWAVLAARSGANLRRAAARAVVTAQAADLGGAPEPGGRVRAALVAGLGLAALVFGGHLLVAGATSLARAWGISDRVIGLSLVALGTSLPELATSVIAAVRGHSAIAIGNVVGSNIFNSLLCLGLAGVLAPVTAQSPLIADLGVLLAVTVAALCFLRRERDVRRSEGALLLLAYVGFVVHLIVTRER
jgi:cation:H+ antiporter